MAGPNPEAVAKAKRTVRAKKKAAKQLAQKRSGSAKKGAAGRAFNRLFG
jgi:hypothetical protein